MATNPSAAPQAHVDDTPSGPLGGNFQPEGKTVAAGNGWQWIVDAWALFKGQWAIWIGMTVVFGLIFVVLSWIPFIGQIALSLLTPVFGAGLLLGAKAVDQGGKISFMQLFEGFKQPTTGKLFALGAVSLLALVVFVLIMMAFGGVGMGLSMMASDRAAAGFSIGMMMLGALVALAVSIPFYMALWFAPLLIVFHDYGVVQALKASFGACLKNIVPFLIYGIVLVVLVFLAMIPIGLGLLVLVPVIVCSVYTAYRDVFFAH